MTERAAGITDLINQVEAMAYELSKSRDENDCDLAGAWSSLAKRSGQELSAITAAMSERDAEIERLKARIAWLERPGAVRIGEQA